MPSVASITTAYNAAQFLPRQIDALLAQSRPLQEIVIVDNASTDGTSAMLAERYPQVTVLRLEENGGAAGGWAAGLKYAALERRHDWIWNFDDDSVPQKTTLEFMLSGASGVAANPEVGMLVPLPVHDETGTTYPPVLWRNRFVKPDKERMQATEWFADIAVASGCMVRREVVEKVGVPRADFFMDVFDFEYCLRMRSQGYKIAVVTQCKMNHEIGETRIIRLPGFRYAWHGHAPWREYYIGRNLVYLAWSLYPKFMTKWYMTMHLFRHMTAIVLFGDKKVASLKEMLHGMVDGWHAKLGRRLTP